MRGGNPLEPSGIDPNECARETQGRSLVFPTLQAIKGWRPPAGYRSPHAEGGAPSAHRQEVNTVEFEPCPGDVAQLGEHLPCTQGVTGSSPVISTSTLSTE